MSYHQCFQHADRKDAVRRVCKRLRHFPQDVGIVCTGISGILVAVPAAEKTGRKFAIVRKPGESCHGDTVEGFAPFTYRFEEKDYVIVDDFIDSGATIKRIVRVMQTFPREVILYHLDAYKCIGNMKFRKRTIPIVAAQ